MVRYIVNNSSDFRFNPSEITEFDKKITNDSVILKGSFIYHPIDNEMYPISAPRSGLHFSNSGLRFLHNFSSEEIEQAKSPSDINFKVVYETNKILKTTDYWNANITKITVSIEGNIAYQISGLDMTFYKFMELKSDFPYNPSTYFDFLEKDDYISLSNGADRIHAGNGNDIVEGKNGTDEIQGGSGADKLYGDGGSDIVDGQYGADFVYGGLGNDRVIGGFGSDAIYGNSGNDGLYAYSYNASKQIDISALDDGNDKLYGGDGNDSLHAGRGKDILYGEADSDVLFADFYGNTTMFGGIGNDKFVFMKEGSGSKLDDRDAIKDFQTGDKINLHSLSGMDDRSDLSIVYNATQKAYIVQDNPASDADDLYITVYSDHKLTATDFIF